MGQCYRQTLPGGFEKKPVASSLRRITELEVEVLGKARGVGSLRCSVEGEVEAMWVYLLIKVYNSVVSVYSRGCATITTT